MSMPSDSLIAQVASELEDLKCTGGEQRFPPGCRRLLRSLPGNKQCADCNNPNPDWASVTFGSLVCLVCSGRHRSFGVQTSFVRSVDMDAWTHTQVLSVLEGGNAQLENFLDRHRLGRTSSKAGCRYHTKAGHFYKTNLRHHVRLVAEAGLYQGREASRRLHSGGQQKASSPPKSSTQLQEQKGTSSTPPARQQQVCGAKTSSTEMTLRRLSSSSSRKVIAVQ